MACEVFKIAYKLSSEYIQDMFSVKTSTYNFRGERKAYIPRVNTTRYALRPFRSEASRIWNSLPKNFWVAESYLQFKGLLLSIHSATPADHCIFFIIKYRVPFCINICDEPQYIFRCSICCDKK